VPPLKPSRPRPLVAATPSSTRCPAPHHPAPPPKPSLAVPWSTISATPSPPSQQPTHPHPAPRAQPSKRPRRTTEATATATLKRITAHTPNTFSSGAPQHTPRATCSRVWTLAVAAPTVLLRNTMLRPPLPIPRLRCRRLLRLLNSTARLEHVARHAAPSLGAAKELSLEVEPLPRSRSVSFPDFSVATQPATSTTPDLSIPSIEMATATTTRCSPGTCGVDCRPGRHCRKDVKFGRKTVPTSNDMGGRSERLVARQAKPTQDLGAAVSVFLLVILPGSEWWLIVPAPHVDHRLFDWGSGPLEELGEWHAQRGQV
jgi:hypothetical protein